MSSLPPRDASPPPKFDRLPLREKRALRTRASSKSAATPKILCIDDEPDMLVALECALTGEGFKVVTAERSAEAWLRMAEHAPDLIVTDYKMPGLTGLELCRQLRARVAWSRIPVILDTAASVPLDTRLYDLRIMKPADLDDLVREIRALLTSATHQELI